MTTPQALFAAAMLLAGTMAMISASRLTRVYWFQRGVACQLVGWSLGWAVAGVGLGVV